MLKAWNNRAEIEIGNSTEYDTKAYQVKMTIVKCTNVQLELFKFNRSQKEMLSRPTHMWRDKKLKYEAITQAV